MRARPILRYHGGKWMLAKWIISHFPSHRIYVEPFGGAASVLLQKPRSYAEVYNDRWDTVVNVFRIMRDPESNRKLKQLLIDTPFSRTEFEQCGDVALKEISDPLEIARRTIFRSFAGFGSAAANAGFATGFRSNCNRSGTTPAHDWVNYPLHLDEFLERLRGVVIENKNAVDLIKQHDGEQTLFYLDPPYVHSTRSMNRGNASYAFEMTDQEHIELAVVLHQIKGMVIISGYDCPLYQMLYGHWAMVKREASADGARPRTELMWMNAATMAGRA